MLGLFLEGRQGHPLPQHSKTKSPSALSRFLNINPWSTKDIIRIVHNQVLETVLKTLSESGQGRRPFLLIHSSDRHKVKKAIKSPPELKLEGYMLNEIIAIYAITDDLLKAIGHDDDIRRSMSDAEIMTTALVAAMFFNGNHSMACAYMKDHNLIPKMLEK